MEKDNQEEQERKKYSGYTLKELLTEPRSEKLLEVYLSDKYGIYIVDEDKFKPLINDNNHYCLKKQNKTKDSLCICKDFRMQDYEGPCACGRYTKKLNDEDFFIKMRIASLKRGNKA